MDSKQEEVGINNKKNPLIGSCNIHMACTITLDEDTGSTRAFNDIALSEILAILGTEFKSQKIH